MVIVATVLSSGQNGGSVALKALHGQPALTSCHIDSREVRRAKLHPPDKVSGSVLCTETQMQTYVGASAHEISIPQSSRFPTYT